MLTPELDFDPDQWLAGMDDALAMLRLDELYRYEVPTVLDSPNWKLTADGYVDGYHIGYLHSSTIGEKAITNRNTYDYFGPHVRIGFANKPINEIRDRPESEWPPMFEVMSMVHYVFPNMSISGQPDRPLMVSRLLPGPTPDRSCTQQYHYYRRPVEGEEAVAMAETHAPSTRRSRAMRTSPPGSRSIAASPPSPTVTSASAGTKVVIRTCTAGSTSS